MGNIKAIREAAEMSQAELAEKLGCSRMTVSRWERGDLPKGDYLLKLAGVFNVTPNDILGIESWELTQKAKEENSQ